ncbi:RNA pseudouridine synthase, partial [Ancylostoma duodenale]
VDGEEAVAHRSDGIEKIRSQIIPIWRMNQDELVDLMTNRVVYSDDNIVAFDKPYGMAYSGASQTAPQMDRLLQKLKAKLAPKCERLYLVKSLDKYQSGVVVFATNTLMQSTLKESMDTGSVEQVSRCIVRGELDDSPLKITIPLIKTLKNRDMKMMPLVTNKAKGDIFYVESECRTIKGNQYVSSVEVVTHKEAPHQIRAHLALAGCPLIGDPKYSNSSPRPPRRSRNDVIVTRINLQVTRVSFPGVSQSNKPVRLSAPLPAHFTWMLKKLNILSITRDMPFNSIAFVNMYIDIPTCSCPEQEATLVKWRCTPKEARSILQLAERDKKNFEKQIRKHYAMEDED